MLRVATISFWDDNDLGDSGNSEETVDSFDKKLLSKGGTALVRTKADFLCAIFI
jgi:hypothetical protein